MEISLWRSDTRDPAFVPSTGAFELKADEARSALDLSPRLSASSEGFFSWRRWYGAPATDTKGSVLPPASSDSDEVSRRVRDALRRRREAADVDGHDHDHDDLSDASTVASSAASSLVSENSSLESAASSSGTWEASLSESSKPATLSRRTSGYEQEDLDALPTLAYTASLTSPRIRAVQSVATLKAPRMIRRVSSSASISPIPVELPPQSPHSISSPVFSSLYHNDDPFAALAETPTVPPSSAPTLAPSPASFRSRLASSLRKSASSLTLRRSSGTSNGPLLPATPSDLAVSAGPSAAAILRDLLLRHDAVVDPCTEPLSPLFDPTLASRVSDREDHDDRVHHLSSSASSSSSSDSSEGERGFHVRGSTASPCDSSPDVDSEDDPFRATTTTHAAWMAPSATVFSMPATHDEEDDEPGDRDRDNSDVTSLDSPSSAFPPFDPFALADLGPAPPLPSFPLPAPPSDHGPVSESNAPPGYHPPPPPPLPRTRPRTRPPARVITKQRSFVDPRTRQLRTAPSLCVTPSTPEKKRFGSAAGKDGE